MKAKESKSTNVGEAQGRIVNEEYYNLISPILTPSQTVTSAPPGPFGLIANDWGDLEKNLRLRDGDVVKARYTDIDPEMVEFVLELAPWITWWKGLQVVNDSGQQIGMVECQDSNKKSDVISCYAEDLEAGGKLILWKGKMLGIHTAMYEIANLEHVTGKRVRLRWSSD